MRLFDDLVTRTAEVLEAGQARRFPLGSLRPWKDAGENVLLLGRESAFELGAGGNGFSACLVTRDRAAVRENEVVLVGKDLNEQDGDRPFARITILLEDDIEEDSDSAYRSVQSMDFVKYHVFPEGYMLRISSEGSRERVRVGRKALAAGMTLPAVGALYAERYLAHPRVRAVKEIFVTDPAAVARLKSVAEEARRRTAALNKILNTVMLDCNVCALKPVCDEVEELKALHFGRSAAAEAQGERK